MELKLLSQVAIKYGYELENLNRCNGCWSKKTDFYNRKVNDKFYCNNYYNEKLNPCHIVWNNKKVCNQCYCIGNRIYASNYFLNKIIHQIIEDSNTFYCYNPNFLTDFNNFTRLLHKELTIASLKNSDLKIIYQIIIESYNVYYENSYLIYNTISKYIESNCVDNFEEYNKYKRLLESSKCRN